VIKIRKKFGGFLAQQKNWQQMMNAAARLGSAAPGHVGAFNPP
jgi:hypothetical protein